MSDKIKSRFRLGERVTYPHPEPGKDRLKGMVAGFSINEGEPYVVVTSLTSWGTCFIPEESVEHGDFTMDWERPTVQLSWVAEKVRQLALDFEQNGNAAYRNNQYVEGSQWSACVSALGNLLNEILEKSEKLKEEPICPDCRKSFNVSGEKWCKITHKPEAIKWATNKQRENAAKTIRERVFEPYFASYRKSWKDSPSVLEKVKEDIEEYKRCLNLLLEQPLQTITLDDAITKPIENKTIEEESLQRYPFSGDGSTTMLNREGFVQGAQWMRTQLWPRLNWLIQNMTK